MYKLPSKETLKRALFRALSTIVGSGLAMAALVVFAPNTFADFKQYGVSVSFAFCVGAVMGFWKFVSGYTKYDNK